MLLRNVFSHRSPRAAQSARRRLILNEVLEGRTMFDVEGSASAVTPHSPGACPCGFCALRAPSSSVVIDNGGMTLPGSGGHGGGDYQVDDRWSTTASGSTGSFGSPMTLTWGFVNDGLSIQGFNGEPTSGSVLQARLTAIYGTMTAAKAVFQQVFDRWSALTGITYIYQATDDGASFSNAAGVLGTRADIRISGHPIDGASNVLAYNFYPNSGGGDMVIDTNDLTGGGYMVNTNNNSIRLRNVLAHEHGHGLGLDHVIPVNETKLMEPFVTTAFDGPQFDDFLAVQALYGDAFEKSGRNETAATAIDLGTLSLGNSQSLVNNVSVFTADLDNFKFTISGQRSVGFTLAPVGGTYQQGPQGGSASSFNASAQADLTLRIYSADGSTLLGSANATGSGGIETISGLPLEAGTYILRVSGTGAAQMYSLTANIAVPGATPSVPNLDSASDRGDSDTDNLTNDNTPTFSGTGPASATITLFSDGVAVGTTTSSAAGDWSVTSSAVNDGVHAFTATATIAGNSSVPSAALNVTFDTVGLPTPTATYSREVSQFITVTFANPAMAAQLASGEAVLTREATPAGTLSPFEVIPITSAVVNGSSVTLAASDLLPDGSYRFTLASGAVIDAAGNGFLNTFALKFFQLGGDISGNGAVNFNDLVTLSQNYGLSGKTWSSGNLDYDPAGNVDFADLVILAQHYNQSLPELLQAPTLIVPASPIAPMNKTKRVSPDVLA